MMNHRNKARSRQHVQVGIYNLPVASPEAIEAALRDAPMLRESLDEAVSCAQIEYDQQQQEESHE